MDWYIGKEWKMERKGLRKIVLALNFTKLEKPTEIAKVVIKVRNVENLQERASKYLASEQLEKPQQLEMGTALTPIDCYLEILVQQMMLGEEAQCFVRTAKSDEEIKFIVTLVDIIESEQLYTLLVPEMFERATLLKENGVAMFKNYPKFAHDYFARAAKYLMSLKPFEGLTAKEDGKDAADVIALFVNIQTNLAACLLAEKRYEDVIYQTQFVETTTAPTEKSIYRRAMAFYCIKEFEKAQQTLERCPNYKEKKEFLRLHQRIAESSKSSNDQYKLLMQRMFS